MNNSELLNIVEEFGSPVYVYNAEKIEQQYNRLTKAFSKVDQFKIHYAVKALSNISVLKVLKRLGSGLDTVSIEEVQLGLYAGFDPSEIMYTPNGVSLEEIETVAALGVKINIDSNKGLLKNVLYAIFSGLFIASIIFSCNSFSPVGICFAMN